MMQGRARCRLSVLAAPFIFVSLGCTAAGSGGGAGPQGTAGSGGSDPGVMPNAPLNGDVGTVGIHQLSAREYNNTLRDLLGTALRPGDAFQTYQAAGFDTLAAAGVMNSRKVADYFDAAAELARDAFSDPARLAAIVTCQPAQPADTSCVESVIKSFGLRAFRRPLDVAEVADFVARYQEAMAQQLDHNAALQHVVRIMLASPQFIYRVELDPDPAVTHPLSGYELATRLSYFLWSSMPDAALFAAAETAELAALDRLELEVDRMLADPRSRELVDNFASQWLGTRRLNGHVVDTTLFPSWNEQLRSAMQLEMAAYFDEFLHGDQTYDQFLTLPVNHVDGALAALYGLPDPGAGTVRVQNDTGQRVGFMGLAGFLTHTSRPDRSAPSIRGQWVVNSLKCYELELPANFTPPALPPAGAGQTERELLELHRADPSCAGCHRILDPVGLGLEHFDAIGRYRDTYDNGLPVDAAGELVDGAQFDGLVELAQRMSQDPEVLACVAHKLFVYGLGRTVGDSSAYLDQAVANWKTRGLSLKNLIKELVKNDTFRLRHGN
jgi:hypothetical protein